MFSKELSGERIITVETRRVPLHNLLSTGGTTPSFLQDSTLVSVGPEGPVCLCLYLSSVRSHSAKTDRISTYFPWDLTMFSPGRPVGPSLVAFLCYRSR